jgi:Protein of unknown function (DUF3632)
MVWEIILDVATSPDVTSEIHEGLVGIPERLQQFAKGELNVWGVSIHQIDFDSHSTNLNIQAKRRVWKDLPLLPMCMEAYFNGMFLRNFF